MWRVRNVRNLTEDEIQLAMLVYKFAIPYDKILISDGAGGGDRPFTMPTRVPTTALFNVGSDRGKYVIHAGPEPIRTPLFTSWRTFGKASIGRRPYWVTSLGMQAASCRHPEGIFHF
jgi:hypothetical protein